MINYVVCSDIRYSDSRTTGIINIRGESAIHVVTIEETDRFGHGDLLQLLE